MPRICPLYDHPTPAAPVERDGKKNWDEFTNGRSPPALHRRRRRGPSIGPAGPPVPVGRHTLLRSRRTSARQFGRPIAAPQPPCRRFSLTIARSPFGHANTASTPRRSPTPHRAHFALNHNPERGNAHGIGNTIELDSACSTFVNRPDEPLSAEPSPCSASTCPRIIGGVHTVVKQPERFSPESFRPETASSCSPPIPARPDPPREGRNPPFTKKHSRTMR